MNNYTAVVKFKDSWRAVIMEWWDGEYHTLFLDPCGEWMTRDGAVKEAKDWAYNNDLEYKE